MDKTRSGKDRLRENDFKDDLLNNKSVKKVEVHRVK